MPERQSVFAGGREIPQALRRSQRQTAGEQDADHCQSGRKHQPATHSEIQKHSYNQLPGTGLSALRQSDREQFRIVIST
jgi:hypothetical protein